MRPYIDNTRYWAIQEKLYIEEAKLNKVRFWKRGLKNKREKYLWWRKEGKVGMLNDPNKLLDSNSNLILPSASSLVPLFKAPSRDAPIPRKENHRPSFPPRMEMENMYISQIELSLVLNNNHKYYPALSGLVSPFPIFDFTSSSCSS